jgi:hypothetical protein
VDYRLCFKNTLYVLPLQGRRLETAEGVKVLIDIGNRGTSYYVELYKLPLDGYCVGGDHRKVVSSICDFLSVLLN